MSLRSPVHVRLLAMALSAVVVVGALSGCATHGMYVRPDVAASAAARESVAARPAPYADADVAFRLLLLGDGGEGYERAPAKAALRDANYERVRTQVLSNRTAITLLGDNIYKAGLPAPRTEHYPNEHERAEGIIEHQLELLSGAGAEVIVVPGNHDWDFSGHAGLARIREQQTFVDGFAADTSFLPRNGCPGPLFRDFGERLRVVAIDTEWLLIESDLDPDPAPPVASMGDMHRFAGREREHRDCEWGLAGKPEIEPAMTNELLYERLDQGGERGHAGGARSGGYEPPPPAHAGAARW